MDIKKSIFNYKEYLKNSLKRYRLIKPFIDVRKRKRLKFLELTTISEEYFKRYLAQYYKKSKKIREIFNQKQLFLSSISFNEKKEILQIIEQEYPDFKDRTIQDAEKILKNQFKVYEKQVNFDEKINWNVSFFNNKNWSFRHISKLDIKPKDEVADIRYNWQFNSHHFLITLGLAYFLSGDEKYSKKIIDLIIDWTKNNPVNYNSSWFHPFITSMRLISWIFSISLINNSLLLNDDLFYKIFETQFQHAYYIFISSSKYSFNHIIGEMFGLFLFSEIYKEIKFIKKLHYYSINLLKKQIRRQTILDGVNIEKSVNYHRIVLEIFTLFLILKPNYLDKTERILINKMYTFLAYIIKPDGSVPLVGDFDDNNIIPLCFYNNIENNNFYKELVLLGSVLFNRGDLKFIGENASPIILLILGINGYNKFKKIEIKIPKTCNLYFEKSGYFIARNEFSKNANYLFFDMASFNPKRGGHDHLDFSNIIYSYKGKNILVDSGTYRYNYTLHYRNLFRDFKAHNVLFLEELTKIKGFDYFGWNKYPKVKHRKINFRENYNFIVQHNAFKDYLIKREILLSKDLEKIDIIDIIIPCNRKEKIVKINLNYHFFIDTHLKIINNEIIINDTLKMKIYSNLNLTIKKKEYKYSPSYGVIKSAPLINIKLLNYFKNKSPLKIRTQISKD